MKWNELKDKETLNRILEESKEKYVLIFKHSVRCATSSMAINRLERNWDENESKGLKPYYLDLIRYREISNAIESIFGVEHQSPQVLVIKNGRCIYDISHMGINYDEIKKLTGEISVN